VPPLGREPSVNDAFLANIRLRKHASGP
jgi:hypothetical protein